MLQSKNFHAEISQRMLASAPLFFNGTLHDVFAELFQNARRAGATVVDVDVVENDDGGGTVTVKDNGCGVADPAKMLSLGGSGWEAGIQEREDPAGIGIYTLASRGAKIKSRAANKARGWSATLLPAHFIGEEEIKLSAATVEQGTAIAFDFTNDESPHSALEGAARFYPVPVRVNGESVDQKRFLGDAIHTVKWRGVTIGVFRGERPINKATVNFHGVTIVEEIASIEKTQRSEHRLYAKVDIETAIALKLVLPARKELVENGFLAELKREATRILFAYVATWREHSLYYDEWRRASALGVTLNEPPARLKPWRPKDADDSVVDYPPPSEVDVTPDCLIMGCDEDNPYQHCLWRAWNKQETKPTILRPRKGFEGYAWHRDAWHIRDVSWYFQHEGALIPLDEAHHLPVGDKPDAIVVCLYIQQGPYHFRSHTRRIEADVVFLNDPDSDIYDVEPLITKGAEVGVSDLVDLIMASYYSPSDDWEAGSWDDQREEAKTAAIKRATTTLISADAAETAEWRERFDRALLWYLPREKRVVFDCDGRDLKIRKRRLSLGARCRRVIRWLKQEWRRRRSTRLVASVSAVFSRNA